MKNRRYCLLGLLGIGLWASGCNRAKPLPSDYFGSHSAGGMFGSIRIQ